MSLHFNPNFSEVTVEICVKPIKGYSKFDHRYLYLEKEVPQCNFNVIP